MIWHVLHLPTLNGEYIGLKSEMPFILVEYSDGSYFVAYSKSSNVFILNQIIPYTSLCIYLFCIFKNSYLL